MVTPPAPAAGGTDGDALESSADYSKYGITDVPKFTTTTAFGKSKSFAGLYYKEWAFLVISFVNITAAIALTIVRLVQVVEEDPASSDFTFAVLLLVNAAFCIFYVVHGVMRERVYELYAFIAAILVVLLYCIFEYAVFNPSHRTDIKLGRLIVACVMAPPNIILAWFVSQGFGYLEFRIVGASQFLQHLYRQAAIFSCLLKFDLQTSCSLVVLVLKEGTSVSLLDTASLAVGLPFSILWCILGWVSLRQELRGGIVAFAVIGLIKPGYYLYKVIKTYIEVTDGTEPSPTITYSLLTAAALALLVWMMLMWEMTVVYRNFGQGLKEHTQDILATETTRLLSGDRGRR